MIKDTSIVMRLIRFSRPIMKWLLVGGLLDILAVICAVIAPALLGDIVQFLFDQDSAAHGAVVSAAIVNPLLILLAVYALYSLFGI